MKGLSGALRESMERGLRMLRDAFVEIPHTACGCGKPVTFTSGRKAYTCTRCGRRWRLTIAVECTRGPRP